MNWIADLFFQIKRLFQWWVVVAPWEEAVRIRAGGEDVKLGPIRILRGKKEKVGAGIHWVIPYIDRIFKQSIRLRVGTLPSQNLTTADGHSLTLSCVLFYEISDLLKLYEKLHDADDTITGMAAAAIAEFVGTHTKAECTPANVELEANRLFSTRGLGVKGTKLNIITFSYCKTYRFITGDAELNIYGDSLNTRYDSRGNV